MSNNLLFRVSLQCNYYKLRVLRSIKTLTPSNHDTRGKFIYKYHVFLHVINNNIITIGGDVKNLYVFKFLN
jgi:hypothetical protein